MKLTILIPALNEAKTIGNVIDQIPREIHGIKKTHIIVIDDGSQDETGKIAAEKGASVITHRRNKGLGVSFQDGLSKAIELRSDIMVTIDADGQFNPQEIPKIIQPIIDQKAEMVTGSRFVDTNFIPANMPKLKILGNQVVARIISKVTDQRFYDVSCGFRAYSKEAMLHLNLFGKFTYTQETFLELAYKGLDIKEVPITVQYFDERESRVAYSLPNYAFKAGKIILRTVKDYRPLKFFGICGSAIFLIGLGLDIFVMQHFIRFSTFSPYKIFGFSGAFLNAVGIMIVFIGILADLMDKIRLTQEKILYYKKKELYDQNFPAPNYGDRHSGGLERTQIGATRTRPTSPTT